MLSNSEPLVSVIMNCYNGEKYVCEAVESVLVQSYQNWEVIFWDNQSRDNSAGLFQSYKDSRLHYHCAPKHTTLGDARNHALSLCCGDLIAFLDVDDWWFPEKLQIQVPLFHDGAVGISSGSSILVNERNCADANQRMEYQSLPSDNVLNDLLGDCFIHFSTFVVRKSAINSLPYPFDPRFSIIEDFDLLVRLSVDWKMASVQEPIAYYRWHQNNTGYTTDLQLSDELNIWYAESKDNPIYKCQQNFSKFKSKVEFYDMLKMLYVGNKREAYRRIGNLPTRQRLKAFAALLLPTRIVRKWIDRS